MVRASERDTSNSKFPTLQTQNLLMGLGISSGLGIPQGSTMGNRK